jgi:hypothetical protein
MNNQPGTVILAIGGDLEQGMEGMEVFTPTNLLLEDWQLCGDFRNKYFLSENEIEPGVYEVLAPPMSGGPGPEWCGLFVVQGGDIVAALVGMKNRHRLQVINCDIEDEHPGTRAEVAPGIFLSPNLQEALPFTD